MCSSLVTRELWEEVASSTECWTKLLTVPGGSGKGEKCFGYLLDYEWDESGAWQYAPVLDMELDIVLPDGTKEGIALLPHTVARVILGISTSPDGDDSHHLSIPLGRQEISGGPSRQEPQFGLIGLRMDTSLQSTHGCHIDYSCGAALDMDSVHCLLRLLCLAS
jgi:hypothetical protein